MKRLALALLTLPLFAAPARADDHPTLASDGVFVGVRLEPGAALSLGYDLDVYLTGDRVLSVGPAASFSFLGEDGADLGQRQDWLLAIDVLRLKVALDDGHGAARPYIFLGGGLYYASLPEQRSTPREVFLVPDGTPATAELRFPGGDHYGGLLSSGLGLDVYFADGFGVAAVLASHVRLSDDGRVPDFWAELAVGLRFGL
ncbi:MAG: hypothetical protein VYE22_36110 [Myxococcota bacterium]|nr:hypothetical protein [Myxococcota bacterium]